MSPGVIPSTDTLSAHPGDLNREASSGKPCSHDARLCLPVSSCALIIPSERSCLLFLQLEMHVCVSVYAFEMCVCVYVCVFVCPNHLTAQLITYLVSFSQ